MCVPFEFNMLELHESNCKSTNIIFFETGDGKILLLPYHNVTVDRVRDRSTADAARTARPNREVRSATVLGIHYRRAR